MRPGAVALCLLVLLLAGCTSPVRFVEDDGIDLSGDALVPPPTSFDALSHALPQDSNGFQAFAQAEDQVRLPDGTVVNLLSGRGLHCQGNPDGVAPNATGWAVCSVRLAARPEALAQDVHELGIGMDVQRLTLLMPAEAIEWRFEVVLAEAAPHGDGAPALVPAFDSGWRRVDLAPRVEEAFVSLQVPDPCDAPDGLEETSLYPGEDGIATLTIEVPARHGQPVVLIGTGASRPHGGESSPIARHDVQPSNMTVLYPTVADRTVRLEAAIHLEADGFGTPMPGGPCPGAHHVAHQEWTVRVGITGSDGAFAWHQTLIVPVTFYVTLRP